MNELQNNRITKNIFHQNANCPNFSEMGEGTCK